MSYYLGVDGGASKTRCALGDELSLLRVIESPSCKPSYLGYESASRSLFELLLQCCAESDVPFNKIKAITIGMSGIWEQHEAEFLRNALFVGANAQMYALPRTEIVSDATIALQACFGDEPGVLVISGTGSIALSRDNEGHIQRAGGYGPLLGDEGSGYWIGSRALQLVLQSCDGRAKPTVLQQAIADKLRLSLPDEARALAMMVNNSSIQVADIAPIVFDAAMQHDRKASQILTNAAEELVELALAAHRSSKRRSSLVCFAGGIASQPLMQSRLRRAIQEHTALLWSTPKMSAVEGALQRARRLMS